MRLEIDLMNLAPREALHDYAEARLWLALQRYARRIAWAGLQLVKLDPDGPARRFLCRIDTWLRGVGHVSVRHLESNPYVAADVAAARLKQAVERRLGHSAATDPGDGGAVVEPVRPEPAQVAAGNDRLPRLAVLVQRRDRASGMLCPLPWLNIKFGIEQCSRVTLPSETWEAAAAGNEDAADALLNRLSLAMLGRPELIVVMSCGMIDDRPAYTERERQRVSRIVRQVRSFGLPVEVLGLWVDEQWEPHCVITSEELFDERPTAAIQVPGAIPPGTLRRSGAPASKEREMAAC